jgi:RNA polymerase sigma-70 factor (ECF subfamily)
MGRPGGFVTDGCVDLSAGGAATSASLLNRVRTFEPAAWARLVELYGPLVYHWCLRAKLQPADAADVGQEVFAAVARTIVRFRRDRAGDSFRGWLYTITRNKIRDRATSHEPAAVGGETMNRLERLPAPDSQPDDEAVCCERGELVRRAVELVRGDFEPATWNAFWRTTVDGRPADEVAAELGLTRNAVYLARARVRRRLADEFAGLIDFEEPAGADPDGTGGG